MKSFWGERVKENQIRFMQLHILQFLGCSEEGGETGAATVKVPSVKKSRTWRNNMSDARIEV